MTATVTANNTKDPLSIQDARVELAELTSKILQIDADLGTAKDTGEYDPNWRRRAIDARRHMLDRKRSLRLWITEQQEPGPSTYHTAPGPVRIALSGVSATVMMREVTKRLGALESVYIASVQLFDDPSDASEDEWRDRVQQAMGILGTQETEDA